MGDSVRSVLLAPVPALPQVEPMFRVTQIDPSMMSPLYQKFRNILVLQLDSTLTDGARLGFRRNCWATPQLVIMLRASSVTEIKEAFMQQRQSIVDGIMQAEMQRFQRAQRAQQDNQIVRKMEEKYHYHMVLPEGFIFAVQEECFCWLRKETKYWGQHVMLYTEPYTDTNQFTTAYIRQLRDRYTRQYVLGRADSSRAMVDDRYYPVENRRYDFPSSPYAVELRGLWGLFGDPGDKMGGPFVSYTFLDTLNRQVVCVDGFLYAPANEKRDLLRQVEAILLSVKPLKP